MHRTVEKSRGTNMATIHDPYDLVVVGGGIIGCGIVDSIRGTPLRIRIVEPEPDVATGASCAAAGGINPHLGDHGHGPIDLMAERSRNLYPEWIARLSAAAGQVLGLRNAGLLQVAIDEKERTRLVNDVLPFLLEHRIEASWLTGDQARQREPLLGPAVVGALAQPRDMIVEPAEIMKAFRRVLAADDRVDFVQDRVVRVEPDGGGVDVTLADGGILRTERVVVAAGHLSHTLLPGLAAENFRPVKGQVLEIQAPALGGLTTQCDALVDEDGQTQVVVASPYAPGRITVGVTQQVGVRDPKPTEEAQRSILRNLRRVLPALAEWKINGPRAGIRPGTTDGAPVLGFLDADERVLAATGHNGLGITLAPRTAQLAARLLRGLPLSAEDFHDLRISNPDRFRTTHRL
ncbi:MAG: FAD-dependent oxidoreductase [Streptosporangiaceae bacterium]